MTVEEHLRAAEHHLTEAFAQLKRGGRAMHLILATSTARKRVKTMLLNMLGLLAEMRKLI